MKWLPLASIAAAGAIALLSQNPTLPPGSLAKPQAPSTDSEKARIEREIEGMWEVTEYNNSKLNPILRASGFMMIHGGWLSINVVVTTKDRGTDKWNYHFVGAAKRYSITDASRLRLEDLWGFNNAAGELRPDVAGTVEERVMTFVGPAEVGQKLRIARAADDSMTFVRRSPVVKPPVPAAPNDR
jgi:hypothetical protein